jgi:hypothetical protein
MGNDINFDLAESVGWFSSRPILLRAFSSSSTAVPILWPLDLASLKRFKMVDEILWNIYEFFLARREVFG